jgi:hypothetical protein
MDRGPRSDTTIPRQDDGISYSLQPKSTNRGPGKTGSRSGIKTIPHICFRSQCLGLMDRSEKRLNARSLDVQSDWAHVFKKPLFRPLVFLDELPYPEISFES